MPYKPKRWDLAASHALLSITHSPGWSNVIFPMLTVPKVIFNSRKCLWCYHQHQRGDHRPPTTAGLNENQRGDYSLGSLCHPQQHHHTAPHNTTHTLRPWPKVVSIRLGVSAFTWVNIDIQRAGQNLLRLLQDRSPCWFVMKGPHRCSYPSLQPSPYYHFLPRRLGQTEHASICPSGRM